MNISIKVATFAYVLNGQGKILLLRRAKHDTFPGRWEFPGGGLDSGENPQSSIEREVWEEAGIRVKAIRPISVITHKNHDQSEDIVRITYECIMNIPEEAIRLSLDHDAYRWVERDELEAIDRNTPLYTVIKELKDTYTVSAT